MTAETPSQFERDLAPQIAKMLAEVPGFNLRIAIADWQTPEGLDALRTCLVARGLFDTEALRTLTDRRRQIGVGT